MPLFHVTTSQNAQRILGMGFEPGWGDVGFGCYFFDDRQAAEEYLFDGGWDGSLEISDAEILSIDIDPLSDTLPFEYVIPHPEWPNPEDYEHVVFLPMKDGETFKPNFIKILNQEEDIPSPD